jgi:hypothetical protein
MFWYLKIFLFIAAFIAAIIIEIVIYSVVVKAWENGNFEQRIAILFGTVFVTIIAIVFSRWRD